MLPPLPPFLQALRRFGGAGRTAAPRDRPMESHSLTGRGEAPGLLGYMLVLAAAAVIRGNTHLCLLYRPAELAATIPVSRPTPNGHVGTIELRLV